MLILYQGSYLLPSTLGMLGTRREASKSIPGQSPGTRISCQLDVT